MSTNLPNSCMAVVRAALEKKAEKVVILDVRDFCDYTEYIIICHGQPEVHVQAIAEHIMEVLKQDSTLHHLEGWNQGRWIVLDYYDFIVHVFEENTRYYYQIEDFWVESPQFWFRDDGSYIYMEPETIEKPLHP